MKGWYMARDFARSFYKSSLWAHNRKAYLDALVDTEGHIVMPNDDGTYCWTDEYGYKIRVNEDSIVPPRMCERCFKRGELVPAKVVHHIEWLDPSNIDNPKVTLGFSNFMRLCQDCHAAVHAGSEESRVTFDEYGNVVWKDE